jgi:hypothetical protein
MAVSLPSWNAMALIIQTVPQQATRVAILSKDTTLRAACFTSRNVFLIVALSKERPK